VSQSISTPVFSIKFQRVVLRFLPKRIADRSVYQQKGFSLVEVLVAMMITLIFITVMLQLFFSAAFLRGRADQYEQAYNWIQEDFEVVLNRATVYEPNPQYFFPLCAATVPASGLAANFLNDAVRGLGGATATIGPRSFGGKSFVMTRTGDYANSADPYKLLQLNYSVVEVGGGKEVAKIGGEVAIYSAFRCPV
jgi:prepilin-type N-terminal cleavage/methylation domain-containing protein